VITMTTRQPSVPDSTFPSAVLAIERCPAWCAMLVVTSSFELARKSV